MGGINWGSELDRERDGCMVGGMRWTSDVMLLYIVDRVDVMHDVIILWHLQNWCIRLCRFRSQQFLPVISEPKPEWSKFTSLRSQFPRRGLPHIIPITYNRLTQTSPH